MMKSATLATSKQIRVGHDTQKAVVFYDGGCPLCSREIAHYRRRRGSEDLVWVDVNQASSHIDDFGLSRSAAMARFHVLDKNGRWQTGAWGFAELWSHLAAYRWLAGFVRTLRLLPLLDAVYRRFAQQRLRSRCPSSGCVRSAD
jgi:predicted DCC family thiol-disulfide oxidoreductase YuxK